MFILKVYYKRNSITGKNTTQSYRICHPYMILFKEPLTSRGKKTPAHQMRSESLLMLTKSRCLCEFNRKQQIEQPGNMLKISSSLSRKVIRQFFSRENILRIFDLSEIAVRVCYLSRYLPCILFSLRVHYSCILFSSLLKRGQLTHVHEYGFATWNKLDRLPRIACGKNTL